MPRIIGSVVKYPARASFLWYAGVITVGTLLLCQPICRAAGADGISWLDAAFTATSATCVTGLAVRSTGGDFSWFGQLVVLVLIQLGGIGIMTVTTFATFHFNRYTSLRTRKLVSDTLGAGGTDDLRWVLRHVILLSLAFEGIGFALLAVRNLFDMPVPEALWHALFHSVSAYCNAGFALYDDSLTRYQGDVWVNLVVIGLLVSGGIGFPVMLDLRRSWTGRWRSTWERLTLHSKMMLLGTAGLLSLGTLAFLALEWHGVLRGLPWWQRLLAAMFHSATCRTAGFNTVAIGSLTNASLFITILLMAVGAGPCSTAGGYKVSTLMVLLARGWSTFRGYSRISVFRRTIPFRVVERATTTLMVFSVFAVLALTTLLVLEQSSRPHQQSAGLFLEAAFEIVSALGTVGLSTGMTSNLQTQGRLIVIALMFIGRLGPISVSVALSRGERSQPFEYPQEELLIG